MTDADDIEIPPIRDIKFRYARIYDPGQNKSIAEVVFDEVQEFTGDETMTITWKENGVATLYARREPDEGTD